MDTWSRPRARALLLALMVAAILWSLSAAGPVYGKGRPGHEDDSYRERHEGKTRLTPRELQLVTESDPRDGEVADGSGDLHTPRLEGGGEQAEHSGEEDQEKHKDYPADSESSGIYPNKEMEDTLMETAEAAAAQEKEFLDSSEKVSQPAAHEQHPRDLQQTVSQPAASQALHLDDDKDKSDQAADQTSGARDAVSSDKNSASCTLASAQSPLAEGGERVVSSSHEASSAAADVRVLPLDSRPTETAAHASTSESEVQTDGQQIRHHHQQQQTPGAGEMAAPKPLDTSGQDGPSVQPVYQPSSSQHLLREFKPTAKLRHLASAISRTELEQMFHSFLGGFLDYMSGEDKSEGPSVVKNDVDSSSTKHSSNHHVTQQVSQPSDPKPQPKSVEFVTNVQNSESRSENENSSSNSGSAVSDPHQDEHEIERREGAV